MSARIRILWDASSSGVVDMPGTWTVGGNPVSFPYTISTSTTFEGLPGTYEVSVTLLGFEIANTPDGTRTVEVREGQQAIFEPSIDAVPNGDNANEFLGRIDTIMAGTAADPTSEFATNLSASMDERIAPYSRPAVASDQWLFLGHSLVANGMAEAFEARTGLVSQNAGIGSQTSDQIAARFNAPSAALTSSFTMPATATAVTVALDVNPVRDGADYDRDGTFADVHGVLRQRGSALSFVPTSPPKQPFTVPAGTPFVCDEGNNFRDRTTILWMFRNDAIASDPDGELGIARAQNIINRLTPHQKRLLILQELPSTADSTSAAAARLDHDANVKAAFPEYWVPIADFLRTAEAATAAGITFTAQDNTDISNGKTPTSFRATGDPLHLNATGYLAASYYVEKVAIERGWITTYATGYGVDFDHLFLPQTWQDGAARWADAADRPKNLFAYQAVPTPSQTTVGGVGVLDFDGTKILRNSNVLTKQPFTLVVVATVDTLPASGRALIVQLASTPNLYLSVNTAGQVAFRADTVDIVARSTIDTGRHVFTVVVDGANSRVEFDELGATYGYPVTGTFPTADGHLIALGTSSTGSGTAALDGKIAAVGIIGSALTPTQTADARARLYAVLGWTPTAAATYVTTPWTSDEFTGTSAADITGRTSDAARGGTGKTWATSGANAFAIDGAGNAVRGSSSTAIFAGFASVPADAEVSVRASTLLLGGEISIRRSATAGGSSNRYRASIATGATVSLQRVIAGAGTIISGNYAVTAADTITLRVVGSLVMLVVNGVIVEAITDTNIAGAGYAGVQCSSSGDAFALDWVEVNTVSAA